VQKIFRGAIALGLVIAAVGLAGRFLWVDSQRNLPISSQSVNPLVESWFEADLALKDLEDIIQDEPCRSSQKYFLSCINAMHSIAAKFQMTINFDGSLGALTEKKLEDSTEKRELEGWQNFYVSKSAAAKKISFQKIWNTLKRDFVLKPERAQEKAYILAIGLNAFLSVFKDPHTYLIPIKYYNEVITPVSTFSNSLGVVLARGKANYFIRKVLEKSPADFSGLVKGDFILEVNHQEIDDLPLAQVGELLKAKEGETTHLLIRREGGVKKIVRVPRMTVEIPTMTWKIFPSKHLGILTLNKFAKGSCEKAQEALLEFSQAHTNAILFDLRDNGGGQLEEASCIASLFLGKDREILKFHYNDSEKGVESLFGSHEQIYFGALGVLINSGTASAAEILAGVLQEYHRAVLVGERTFGKGSFQEGETWDSNPRIALFETKGLFTMPSGRSPQLTGILPDFPVRFREAQALREEDLYINPVRPPTKMRVSLNLPGWANNAPKCLNSRQNQSAMSGTIPFLAHYDPQLEEATKLVICSAVAQNLNGF
jgi:carboxyl-terminal processing protease